jgi:hypothetical protein
VFDHMQDQAAGLRSGCTPAAVKLVPIVFNRDAATAFDVLWTLGTGLSLLGHGVVALDATTREHGHTPGLFHQLRGECFEASGNDEDLHVLAAQAGLAELLTTAATLGANAALARLARSFAADAVVLVLAPKEWLSVLFESSGARPLIPFAIDPTGVVDAYSAVKVLMQAGNMQPVLVPVRGEGPDEMEYQAMRVLLETARKHLGDVPGCWVLPDSRRDESRDVFSSWMLKILGNALTLGDSSSLPTWMFSHQREALVPHLWSC